jgi:hypothetical protein
MMMGLVGTVYAQSVGIYQVFDMAGQSEHQILTKEESTKLANELKEEAKVFPAIMATAKKEWEANKDNKMPFPAAKIKLRTAKKIGTDFPSKEAAMKKLTQIEDRIAEKIADDAKEKKTGKKNQKPDPEDVAKETLKNTLINNAISDVNGRMVAKLAREVPVFGFMSSSSEKKEEKKDAPKDVKKDAPKDGEKKDAEKKPAH